MFVYEFPSEDGFLPLKFDSEEVVKALLAEYKLYRNKVTGYFLCDPINAPEAPSIYLQRVIGEVPEGLVGDHLEGDLLDFRRANIQAITQRENCQKKDKPACYAGKPTTSKFKGNCWDERFQKWYTYIRVNGVLLNLGYYANPSTAAVVYNIFARLFFGKHANLNKAKVTKHDLALVNFAKIIRNAIKNLAKRGLWDAIAKLLRLK